jgi:hypothetical protein
MTIAKAATAIQKDKYSSSSGYWEGDRKAKPRHPWADVESLSIQCYSDHPEVYAMAELIVDSYLKTKKKVHDRDGYIRCARKLVASLWFHPSDWFRFSTKAEHFGKGRKQVWMSHKVLSLFRHMTAMEPPLIAVAAKAIPKAISKDGKGHSAIYGKKRCFTDTLRDLTQNDIGMDPDLPRVTLRNDEDIWIPIPNEEKEKPWYQFSEGTLKAHSDMLYKADIRLSDGSAMPPYHWHYVRRFKGSLKVTGRLYSTFVTYPKLKRLGITFEGQPATSLDFSSLHPNLLFRVFHQQDHEQQGMLLHTQDSYEIPTFSHLPRAVHKQCINTLLNAKTERSAEGSLINTHYWYDPENDDIEVVSYDGKQKRRGLKAFPGDGVEAKRYINSFRMFHPQLAPFVCKGVGNALQWLDSEIMLLVLRLGVETGIPVLPVHDEVVFPACYLEEVEHFLTRAVQTVLRDYGKFGLMKLKQSGLESDKKMSLEKSVYLSLQESKFDAPP